MAAGVNPDPNHTHADFAVFVEGKQLDFSDEKYMSSEQKHLGQYLHLHDGLGSVIHRHKPGLTLGEFFATIGFTMERDCFATDTGQRTCNAGGENIWRLFVNATEQPFDPSFAFNDTDHLLLSYGSSDEEIFDQLKQMTDDACLYSRTCPERGEPPAENCIADPAVPCVAP